MGIAFFFIFLMMAGTAISAVAAVIARLVSGSWRIAFATLVAGIACTFGAWVLICILSDTFIRGPVAPEKLPGKYTLDAHSRDFMKNLGYTDFSGQIILDADGHFTATRIPDCLLRNSSGAEPTQNAEYDDCSGTWKLETEHAGLSLSFSDMHSSGEISPNPGMTQQASPTLYLMKGNPVSLGFEIFASGDDWYMEYERSDK
jgi:hypothetical protein